jgi:hypothetical protein
MSLVGVFTGGWLVSILRVMPGCRIGHLGHIGSRTGFAACGIELIEAVMTDNHWS